MINKAVGLNESNFEFTKVKSGITPGAFGIYFDRFGEKHSVVLKLSTPNLNEAMQHKIECFASEVLLRLGQKSLPIIKVSVSPSLKNNLSQMGIHKEWYGKEILSEGTIKLDYNSPQVDHIESIYEIGEKTGASPASLRSIDGCVRAIKARFGEETPLVNDFITQQLAKIFINNNDYNVDDIFSVITFKDGSVAPLPMYDLGSSVTIGAFSKPVLERFGLDGNSISHDLNFGQMRVLNSALYNQGTAMGTMGYSDNWWNDISQKHLVEYISKNYPTPARDFYTRLTGFDEEDIFYITDMMESCNILEHEEKGFLVDFMWARQEEMMHTMEANLFQDSCQ